MATKEEIVAGVKEFFDGEYETVNGRTIPNVSDIALGNKGTEIELAMLFIDIKKSTQIVDSLRRITAARMYKAFLWGIAKIARMNDGELRSFNGDGVLVAFYGDNKRTDAVKAALQMSWFSKTILKPKLDLVFQGRQQLLGQGIEFEFGIGIDVGKVLVVRGGIPGENNNDLVWVGNATNYAVKLSALCQENFHIYISEEIYKHIDESIKLTGDPKKNMWEPMIWNAKGGIKIYRSHYILPIG